MRGGTGGAIVKGRGPVGGDEAMGVLLWRGFRWFSRELAFIRASPELQPGPEPLSGARSCSLELGPVVGSRPPLPGLTGRPTLQGPRGRPVNATAESGTYRLQHHKLSELLFFMKTQCQALHHSNGILNTLDDIGLNYHRVKKGIGGGGGPV